MQPLVSVLVPVYGVEPYMAQCAHALFAQTYENIEYIFVDDCSPDRSIGILQEVLSQYPQRMEHVKIVRHERNRGLAAARNSAADSARGEWVLMHDSDDWLVPDAVERLIAATADGVDMVTCDIIQEGNPLRPGIWTQSPHARNGTDWLSMSLRDFDTAVWVVWNKLLRRSLLTDTNIRWVEGVDMAEDLALTFRAASHARKVCHVAEPLIHYRIREDSITEKYQSRQHEHEVSFCICFKTAVDHIRQTAIWPVVRREFVLHVLRRKLDHINESGLDSRYMLRNLEPWTTQWLVVPGLGLSLRKRFVVLCGFCGWQWALPFVLRNCSPWKQQWKIAKERTRS